MGAPVRQRNRKATPIDGAFRHGFDSRLRGDPARDAPAYRADQRDLREAWIAGWNAAGEHVPQREESEIA